MRYEDLTDYELKNLYVRFVSEHIGKGGTVIWQSIELSNGTVSCSVLSSNVGFQKDFTQQINDRCFLIDNIEDFWQYLMDELAIDCSEAPFIQAAHDGFSSSEVDAFRAVMQH